MALKTCPDADGDDLTVGSAVRGFRALRAGTGFALGDGEMLSPLAVAVAAIVIPVPPAGVPPAPTASPSGLANPGGPAPLTCAVPPLPVVPAPPSNLWYGRPALVIDGLALSLAASGFAGKAGGIFLLGSAGFLLGAPINHLAHQRYGAAAGSLVLRALAAGAAFAIFVAAYPSEHCDGDVYADHPCQHETALLLGGLVMAGTAIVDDVWIARAAPRPSAPKAVVFTPGFAITPERRVLFLGAAF